MVDERKPQNNRVARPLQKSQRVYPTVAGWALLLSFLSSTGRT